MPRCPTCKQPMPPPAKPKIRRCYDCKKELGRHDKYTLEERGEEGILTFVHRCCENPEWYHADQGSK